MSRLSAAHILVEQRCRGHSAATRDLPRLRKRYNTVQVELRCPGHQLACGLQQTNVLYPKRPWKSNPAEAVALPCRVCRMASQTGTGAICNKSSVQQKFAWHGLAWASPRFVSHNCAVLQSVPAAVSLAVVPLLGWTISDVIADLPVSWMWPQLSHRKLSREQTASATCSLLTGYTLMDGPTPHRAPGHMQCCPAPRTSLSKSRKQLGVAITLTLCWLELGHT